MRWRMMPAVVGLCVMGLWTTAVQADAYRVASPNGKVEVHINIGETITWTLMHEQDVIIAPSAVSLKLHEGPRLGRDAKVVDEARAAVHETIATPIYRKSEIVDHYYELTLTFEGGFGLIFRVYDDGAAYRFFTAMDGPIVIEWEQADLNFADDHDAYVPYMRGIHDGYHSHFESHYTHVKLSELEAEALMFTPLLVEVNERKKAVILEADLEDYPGQLLRLNTQTGQGLVSDYARYPLEEVQGGHLDLQLLVARRADFIARTQGTRVFPWRAVVVSTEDVQLLDNDMVYKLAAPSRVEDISWIQPGKAAWEWWHDWNISRVDFRAGINTQTYKYYIDFAAENGLDYMMIDDGWSQGTDLFKTVPELDMQAIIDHAEHRGVGVLLWAGWGPLDENMEEVFAHYAAMGVKGFKIDFMTRDDQRMVNFFYRAARKAAAHKLILNMHGSYKPTGLQRTYPNMLVFEGVLAMEHQKWSDADMPRNDVMIPFIRMLAGPMDFTPGAMNNATRQQFRPSRTHPMSQGTRCHQLAMFIVYEAPLAMLADSPTAYKREPQSIAFISSVPTVFDRTVPLAGKVGQYVAVARQKDDAWYVGALTNWDARQLTLDFSFLPQGEYRAVIFSDGINADRDATDHRREERIIQSGDRLDIQLAPGGGWAARLELQ